jgi:hypothetical protein
MQIICSLKSAIYSGLKNRRTTTAQRYKNARNSRMRSLAFTAVGTLIHKGYCSPHLAASGHTTTGSRVEFKFPELLGSPTYTNILIQGSTIQLTLARTKRTRLHLVEGTKRNVSLLSCHRSTQGHCFFFLPFLV